MNYKQMCIQQGYIPSTCKMDGKICWLLIQDGIDPCKGCNMDRTICNGRNIPHQIEELIDKQQTTDFSIRRRNHIKCNAKIILTITTTVGKRDKLEIEIKVKDLIAEKGYVTICDSIDVAEYIVCDSIKRYGVEQVQCDIDGYSQYIYDKLCNSNLNVDIVPIKYNGLRWGY